MRFLILVVAFLVAAANATPFNQCKNNQPAPLEVDVIGCEKQPCDVVKGTTLTMYVHFVGKNAVSQRLSAKVRATTLGITVPYELPEDVANVCKNLMYGATCPIYASEDVVYKFNFYVDTTYPEIGVKVEVSLIDESNVVAACFSIDIKVKKGAIPNLLE